MWDISDALAAAQEEAHNESSESRTLRLTCWVCCGSPDEHRFAAGFLSGMCVETMEEQVPGSHSTTRTEGSRGGESTASSETREDDEVLEVAQDRDGTSVEEKCTTSKDIPNEVDDNDGLQGTGACHDLNHTEDLGDSSEQVEVSFTPTKESADCKDPSCESNDSIEGTFTGPFDRRLAVSTGNIDTQQTSEDSTTVDHLKSEPSTVGKHLSENTKIITEILSKVQNTLQNTPDAVPSIISLKDNHPIVPKGSEVESKLGSDNERKDVQALEANTQAPREGHCKGLNTSSVAVESATSKPESVSFKAIPSMDTFSHLKSLKVTPNQSKPGKDTFSRSKSSREASTYLESPRTTLNDSKSLKGTSISEETQRPVSISEIQEETNRDSGASSAVLTSEVQSEVGVSQEDPSTVSASTAQEESNESSEAPSSVLISAAQKVSESQETSSIVLDSVVKEDVDKILEAFSTLSTSDAQGEVSVSSEVSRMEPSSKAPKDVDTSSGSESTLEGQEEISTRSESPKVLPNSEVQNKVGIHPEAPSRVCEVEETNSSSEASSTVSTFEARKDIGTSPKEITTLAEVREGLQRKSSQIGKEKANDFPQNFSQQSETTVPKYEGGLQAGGEEGKKTSVPTGDVKEIDYSQTLTEGFQNELARKDRTIADLDEKYKNMDKKVKNMEALGGILRGKYKALDRQYDELYRNYGEVNSSRHDLEKRYHDLEKRYQDLKRSYKERETENVWKMSNKDKLVSELRGQWEEMKKENGNLQNQISLLEQQHANEQSRGGSYLDDTKAATPALLVSALNGVKDASNNFVKVLRTSLQQGSNPDFEKSIGAVSRNGHIKFQYQAYICRILFRDFHMPHAGSSKVALSPTIYFHQYQTHDLKKTDTVERLLHDDREIDASLHQFCFVKFSDLMENIENHLTDRSIDLKQQVRNSRHPQDSKLYVSFCKLAVSVWLLQRLAFSFVHPAKQFFAQKGEPLNLSRMQSVVPLDEPGADEEMQLKVSFYVLPGFDIGNSVVPCEVYVTTK